MVALDTNVLLYACDRADPKRQQIAFDLIANSRDGVLLWQVACEFVAASRKLTAQGFAASDAWKRLETSLTSFRWSFPRPVYLRAASSYMPPITYPFGMP